jgi:hypothetical protein
MSQALLTEGHDVDQFSRGVVLPGHTLAANVRQPLYDMHKARRARGYIEKRARKKVEALFAELKNQIGLRRVRLRRLKFVREQFFLAATAQNLKRLVRFLARIPKPPLALTA